jgi:glyoxylase-like metal-dependent hydrolase (beta-lactamase superfamily II)
MFCAVINSVADIDMGSGSVTYDGAESIIKYVKEHNLTVQWVIETHGHADHLSAGLP